MAIQSDTNEIERELIASYTTKEERKRAKQIIVNEVGENKEVPQILANVRTIPGIITMRGCSYAG